MKIKSTNDPWITPAIRRLISCRKRVFKKNRRGIRWEKIKKKTKNAIKEAKRNIFSKFKEKAETTNDPSFYYKVLRMLKDKEKPKPFDIKKLQPKLPEQDLCEELPDFFGAIS